MQSELNKKLLNAIVKNDCMFREYVADECEKICLQEMIDLLEDIGALFNLTDEPEKHIQPKIKQLQQLLNQLKSLWKQN